MYKHSDFEEDKLVIARLIEAGRHREALEIMTMIHRVASDNQMSTFIRGALFILDLVVDD